MRIFGTACAICLTDFERGDSCALPVCGHILHRECFDNLLRHRHECPSCRSFVGRIIPKEELFQHALDEAKSSTGIFFRIAFLVNLIAFKFFLVEIVSFPIFLQFSVASLMIASAAVVARGLYVYLSNSATIPVTYTPPASASASA